MTQASTCIASLDRLQRPVGQGDLRALAANFGPVLGLSQFGVNHEVIPPGCRSSEPHAHSHEEEFVFVLEGTPDLWLDGELHRPWADAPRRKLLGPHDGKPGPRAPAPRLERDE